MRALLLGGGLAGVSAAFFLQNAPNIDEIVIFEKEAELGGLCRSFVFDNRKVDIGPHIIFSKDTEILEFMKNLLGDNYLQHRRQNYIPHKGKRVSYPFENYLSDLPETDCTYCLKTFLDNPYREYKADNMLQFFLKIFGEGITNLYLRPYNEKIWKFDPAFMDTKMVDRIPRPPDEDIISSAKGKCMEGHLHQLHFFYPKTGGIASLIAAIARRFFERVRVQTSCAVESVAKVGSHWEVATSSGAFRGDCLISCMPVNELVKCYIKVPAEVSDAARNLKYNHILIALAKVENDAMPMAHTLTIADKEIPFHRLSKVDFMGGEYQTGDGTTTYMMEYTYANQNATAALPEDEIKARFSRGLQRLGLIQHAGEVLTFATHKFMYAYVIYDQHHTRNMESIRRYFGNEGVYLCGRFGNFEYWNMDRVIRESWNLADRIKQQEGR